MGVASFLHSLRGKSQEPSSSPPSSPSQQCSPTSNPANTDGFEMLSKDSHRRSPALNLSRPNATHCKDHRSWFDERLDIDQALPDTPISPFTAPPSAHSVPYGPDLEREYLKFSRDSRAPVEALPTPPLTPCTSERPPLSPCTSERPPLSPTTTMSAYERKDSHISNAHRRKSSTFSTRSRRKSRSSFWESSNPDDSDVPPVPALSRGASSESITQSISGESVPSSPTSSMHRPMSVASTTSRRSYVPRSAARGFLRSTSGASVETRASFRASFNVKQDVDMVCLTDEQRLEWAKLMAEDVRLGDIPTPAAEMGKHHQIGSLDSSQMQALAALECGAR